jgi:hypothetical protein
MSLNISNGHKIDRMAMYNMHANIFHCRYLLNLPKFGFLVWKFTIWQPWSKSSIRRRKLSLESHCHDCIVVGSVKSMYYVPSFQISFDSLEFQVEGFFDANNSTNRLFIADNNQHSSEFWKIASRKSKQSLSRYRTYFQEQDGQIGLWTNCPKMKPNQFSVKFSA